MAVTNIPKLLIKYLTGYVDDDAIELNRGTIEASVKIFSKFDLSFGNNPPDNHLHVFIQKMKLNEINYEYFD